ncbi:MFS transporter [Pseudalkalibacillus berkeleyi]|uniref:MFS transporter n=1 Tax=Pseudalkalibacillus berkeleyi TaxID=1069813 RepID=A0ABS9GXU2_9BACL|nr:MFS transporter [Pseudalkalibacillus berkeleyi]MCF6136430.1 MFS transporter [Pseudalkalibacillus berkeleyi]
MIKAAFNQAHALKSKSFRQFMLGSFFVRTTDWMDLTLLNWLVYQWTQSPVALGVLNACRLMPIFIFGLQAGVLADRYDRKKVLLISYAGIFISTLLLAYFVFADFSILWLYAVVFGRSLFMTIEVPVRNAFLADLVNGEQLPNAISIQTLIINVARMIGPALAGWLLLHMNAPDLFILIALGTIVVTLALNGMKVTEKKKCVIERSVTSQKTELKETFQYIKENHLIVSILLIAVAPMIFGFPYTTMLPLFVEELMDMGPDGFGLLLSVSSVGAIIATLVLSMKPPRHQGKILVFSALGFGLFLGFFIMFNGNYLLSILLMLSVGFTSQLYRTTSRITLQMQVADQLRGRVLSIALMDRAYIPLGALIIGFVAAEFGALAAGLFMGFGCFITTLLIVWKRPDLWHT